MLPCQKFVEGPLGLMSGSSSEMKTQVPCAAGLHMLKTPQQNSVESPLGINRGFHEEL